MAALDLDIAYDLLDRQLRQFREAIDGIPDKDLHAWRPAAASSGGGEMNTFSALAVHITGAGTWRLFEQIYGDPVDRNRDAEFDATATANEIDNLFDAWLAGFRERLARPDQPDLTTIPDTPREDHPDWTRLHWLLSTIDHTALHLGHAQIHRQLWLAEHNPASIS